MDDQPVIFVIDDDASVRTGLSRLVSALGFQVETYCSAEDFLARGRYKGPGCLVLDVRMPGLTGIDLQEELAKDRSSLPIVFITGHGNIPMGITAMKKGAVDFLQKPFDDNELLEAISRAVEKHHEILNKQAEKIDARRRLDLLSPREYEIFRYVITGMLNKQIGHFLNIAEKTVKVHRGRVMAKLGANSVADLVRLAERAGVEQPSDERISLRPPQ